MQTKIRASLNRIKEGFWLTKNYTVINNEDGHMPNTARAYSISQYDDTLSGLIETATFSKDHRMLTTTL